MADESVFLAFNNASDTEYEFTKGQTGSIMFYCEDDIIIVDFDKATDANSPRVVRGTHVEFPAACTKVNVKGVSGSGNVSIIATIRQQGISDADLRASYYTRKN